MLYLLAGALVLTNAGWLAFLHFFLKDVQAERAELLNRIQAPKDAAIASALTGVEPGATHVPFDSDDEYWKAVGERS